MALENQSDDLTRVLKVFYELRMGDENLKHVLTEYSGLLAARRARARFDTGYKAIFKSIGMRKRLLHGFYATSLQQAGGIAALTMYATPIHHSLECECIAPSPSNG